MSSRTPRRAPAALAAALLTCAATPPAAGDLAALQALDARLADVAWRVVSAEPELCLDQFAGTGLALHAASQYEPHARAAAAEAFGLRPGRVSVLAAARGSPAEAAGLEAGDVILAIAGHDVSEAETPAAASYDFVDRASRLLEGLAPGVAVDVAYSRRGEPRAARLTPSAACASRVELAPGGAWNANANGRVVKIYGRLLAWAGGDDELALIVAHEVAHNGLRHAERIERGRVKTGILSAFGRSGRLQRQMEREADALAISLARAAGFDYCRAPRLFAQMSARTGLGALVGTTHPSAGGRHENARRAMGRAGAETCGLEWPGD